LPWTPDQVRLRSVERGSAVNYAVGVESELTDRLASYLSDQLGAAVRVTGLARLPGGASRETWAFDARVGGRTLPLVLRRDPPGRPGARDCARELRLLRAAAAAGVPVPAAHWGESSPDVLDAPFLVMQRVEGETIPRRILREPALAEARERLVGQCGQALAGVHRIAADGLDFLGEPQTPAHLVASQRDTLDALGEPHPVFELALRWLAGRVPARRQPAVVHGDFRVGNVIVGPEGLRAVLDWELAHAGDPAEDLGWFCVRAWRFGSDARPAGGLGSREELLEAYRAAGGAAVGAEDLRFWEVYGTLRWGVMCVIQASAHLTGAVRSVELAAIGRRACEMEWALLELVA
jgi:aminoglycoside phosphotransferase (APT) family kinase protein